MPNPVDINHLRQWIGRTETIEDVAQPSAVAQWHAMLDKVPDGDRLPRLAHWLFFTPRAPWSDLGPDGHPKLGGFMPPVPLPRRMWAGSQLRFLGDITLGATITRTTTIEKVALKDGKQGPLVFVTLAHAVGDGRSIAIEERQDIVYRAPSTDGPASAAPPGPAYDGPAAEYDETIVPDEALLFRYSALTFNAHRIHYDLPYARDVEGYPSLVVQGPMTATMLIDRAARWGGRPPTHFAFRGVSPLFVNQPIRLCARHDGDELALWALAPGNRLGMTATARWSDS